MAVIANLDINVRGSSASAETALDKTKDKVKKLKDETEKGSSRIGRAFDAIGAKASGLIAMLPAGSHINALLAPIAGLGASAVAGAASFSALGIAIGGVVAALAAIPGAWIATGLAGMGGIADINKASDKFAISTEDFIAIAHKGKMSTEELDTNLQKLAKNLSEGAAGGAEEATKALNAMGLSIEELHAKPFAQAVGEIGNAMQKVGNQQDLIAYNLELFGRGGVGMVKALKDGVDGLKKAREEADALGLTVTKNQAMQVAAAKGAMANIQRALTGVARTAAITIAPFVELIANAVTDAIKWFNTFRDDLIDWSLTAAFVFKNFWDYLDLYFTKALLKVTEFTNATIHFFTDVLPQVLASFGELIYNGIENGFKDGFDAAWEKAKNDVKASMARAEGDIERSLRQSVEADEKRLEAARQKFLEDKKKAILPPTQTVGKDKDEDIKGHKDNAAVVRGSVEAFKIIANAQGDKMFAVQNDQLTELRKINEELRKNKGVQIGKARL